MADVQRVLQGFVGQAVPLLQAVHALNPGKADPPARQLVGYNGSITAIKRADSTTHPMSARNFSRRVRFFFIAYSALAKLRWFISVVM